MHTNLKQLADDLRASLLAIDSRFNIQLIELEHTGRIVITHLKLLISQFEMSFYQDIDNILTLNINVQNIEDSNFVKAILIIIDRYKFEVRQF